MVKAVKAAAEKYDVHSVLDIGVGTGELAHMILLVLDHRDYTGVDVSRSAIEKARGLIPSAIDFDAVKTSFKQKRDMVLCFNMHYHIATDERAKRLIYNVLDSAQKVVLFLTWNERILERGPLAEHCHYRPFKLPVDSDFSIFASEVIPSSPHKTLYTLTNSNG